MAISSIQQAIIQSSLSAVQQKNKVEEERELKERKKAELKAESEVLSVDPKENSVAMENSEGQIEKVTLPSSKNKAKTLENQIVQESYLGKNIDLKG